MQQIVSLLVLSVLFVGILSGCSGEREATFAGQPQAENQRPKTKEEILEHYVVMLNLEENEKKNLRAIRRLQDSGADAAFAIPELEKAAESNAYDSVREAAKAAIEQIKAAPASGQAEAEE